MVGDVPILADVGWKGPGDGMMRLILLPRGSSRTGSECKIKEIFKNTQQVINYDKHNFKLSVSPTIFKRDIAAAMSRLCLVRFTDDHVTVEDEMKACK